jgi:IS4 transposase
MYQGKTYTLDSLYKKVSKNMKKFPTIQGKYASIKVLTKKGLEVKIVFCSIENAKKWGAVLSTYMDLSSEEILKIYTKRLSIEPFFKECKQHLYLGKEQCRNFDSIFAQRERNCSYKIYLSCRNLKI